MDLDIKKVRKRFGKQKKSINIVPITDADGNVYLKGHC